ncbi:MAG: hypothetical protein IJ660_04545 [Alphaproteobacteria bacterium]|nr:hypothetical protein [Alphaproteobacteria bacterium]
MLLNKMTRNAFGAILLLGMTSSCSISTEMDATVERDVEKATVLSEKAKLPDKAIAEDVVRVKNDIWLGDVSEIEYDGQPLPANFETKDGVTLISNRPITLYEIGDMINKITGVRVSFAGDMNDEARETAQQNKPNPKNVNVDWTEPNKMLVSYQGPLSGLLDEIGSRFGVWWKYDKKEIYFYKNITRTFVLYSLPSEPSMNVSLGGSASGSGATNSLTMSNSAKLEFWGNIENSIKSMIDASAQLSMDSSNGTVVVTANPNDIKKVAKFINEQNVRLSRQVAISVKVYQVNVGDSDYFNLNLSAMFQDPAFVKRLKSITVGEDGSKIATYAYNPQSIGIAGLGAGDTSIADNLSLTLLPGNFDVSAAMKALSTQATTSLITSGTVTTLNNKPAPIQVVKKQNYISEITKTNSGGDSNYYDISTETQEIETGFTMNVLPRILEHGRIMMMFNLTLSDLLALDKVSLDGGTAEGGSGQYIQNPIVESRGFSQEVVMTSGQSLVLTGYERVENTTDKSGVGSATNSLLGGSASAKKTRSILVIVLTPVVLESPLNPESRMHNI